jgi:FMN phosphatase YigB (HAD superfamily)
VFFDVGETLLDESRAWTEWADWLGVPALTLLGVLGAVIERRQDHLEAFRLLRPGFDLEAERRARAAAGAPDEPGIGDLYPDARPCLDEMRRRGYVVGVVGNTSAEMERFLRDTCDADIVASSAGLGAAKPAQAFFTAIAQLAELDPTQIAYAGDRVEQRRPTGTRRRHGGDPPAPRAVGPSAGRMARGPPRAPAHRIARGAARRARGPVTTRPTRSPRTRPLPNWHALCAPNGASRPPRA